MAWFKKKRPQAAGRRPAFHDPRRASGSSATTARRSSTRRKSHGTPTSARSATTTSASARASGSRSLFDDGRYQSSTPRSPRSIALGFEDTKPYADAARESTRSRPGCKDAVISTEGLVGGSRWSSRPWSTASWAARWAPSSARRSRARSSAAIDERPAADRHLVLGRRAHAGGRALAHADGEDRPPRSAGSTRPACRSSRC